MTHPFLGETMGESLEKIAKDVLEPLGYEVLEAVLLGSGRGRVFRVRLDRADEAAITVADLERANRILSLELDRLDPIPGRYRLEVESPGPDRPLLKRRHFERFLGLKARVRTASGRFQGTIARVDEDSVTFVLASGEARTLKLGTFRANLAEWPKTPR